MKRLYLLLIGLFVAIALLACTPVKEPWEQMNPHTEPFRMEVCLKDFCLFDKEKLWVTHELKLNDEQMLYYAPKSIRVGENLYTNEREVYFIRDGTDGRFIYKEADKTMLRQIFRE